MFEDLATLPKPALGNVNKNVSTERTPRLAAIPPGTGHGKPLANLTNSTTSTPLQPLPTSTPSMATILAFDRNSVGNGLRTSNPFLNILSTSAPTATRTNTNIAVTSTIGKTSTTSSTAQSSTSTAKRDLSSFAYRPAKKSTPPVSAPAVSAQISTTNKPITKHHSNKSSQDGEDLSSISFGSDDFFLEEMMDQLDREETAAASQKRAIDVATALEAELSQPDQVPRPVTQTLAQTSFSPSSSQQLTPSVPAPPQPRPKVSQQILSEVPPHQQQQLSRQSPPTTPTKPSNAIKNNPTRHQTVLLSPGFDEFDDLEGFDDSYVFDEEELQLPELELRQHIAEITKPLAKSPRNNETTMPSRTLPGMRSGDAPLMNSISMKSDSTMTRNPTSHSSPSPLSTPPHLRPSSKSSPPPRTTASAMAAPNSTSLPKRTLSVTMSESTLVMSSPSTFRNQSNLGPPQGDDTISTVRRFTTPTSAKRGTFTDAAHLHDTAFSSPSSSSSSVPLSFEISTAASATGVVEIVGPGQGPIQRASSASSIPETRNRRKRNLPGPAGNLPQLSAEEKEQLFRSRGIPFRKEPRQEKDAESRSSIRRKLAAAPKGMQDSTFANLTWETMLKTLDLPLDYKPSTLSKYKGCHPALEVCLSDIPSHPELYQGKVKALVVQIKEIVGSDMDASVTLMDPSGEMRGTIQQKVMDVYNNNEIRVGTVMALKDVSVFSPTKVSHYLNITLRNIEAIFMPKTQSTRSSNGDHSQGGPNSSQDISSSPISIHSQDGSSLSQQQRERNRVRGGTGAGIGGGISEGVSSPPSSFSDTVNSNGDGMESPSNRR